MIPEQPVWSVGQPCRAMPREFLNDAEVALKSLLANVVDSSYFPATIDRRVNNFPRL
jgi:hypothetical protein